MNLYRYHPGTSPLLINVPHAGTHLPDDIKSTVTPEAQQLPDTDWHVDRLYDFARDMGAHLLVATHSRYVVDLNRAASDESLYPGQFTTGVCPTQRFNGEAIYMNDTPLSAETIKARLQNYWQPYHAKLTAILEEIRNKHGHATLYDAHSIGSRMPLLFDGQLPDLNLGTADGATLSAPRQEAIENILRNSGYSVAINGRFKGGYNTRHYGRADGEIQSVQMEIAQLNYMNETTYEYDDTKASSLQIVLREIIASLLNGDR